MGLMKPDVVKQVMAMMVQDGVALSDDLNQCERAILAWTRETGAALLEAHLAGKKTATKGPPDPARAVRTRPL